MKRMTVLMCAALLGLALLAGCNQQKAGITVGVVDEAAAFQKNQAAAKAMTYLQELGAPMQKKAEEAYKAMQADQTEANVAAYKAAMGELQSVMSGEQQRIVALIDAKFKDVLENYRKEKGLTVILNKESAVSFDESVNITEDIVAAMDKLEIDFTAPAKPEAEAAPAAEKEEKAAE